MSEELYYIDKMFIFWFTLNMCCMARSTRQKCRKTRPINVLGNLTPVELISSQLRQIYSDSDLYYDLYYDLNSDLDQDSDLDSDLKLELDSDSDIYYDLNSDLD